MKKTMMTVACALAVITALSFPSGNTGLGLLNVDVVSAATGEEETTETTETTKTAETAKPAETTKTAETTKPASSTTTKTNTSTTSVKVTRILRYGSKGSDVRTLQTLLNQHGYKLKVDGAFGKLTLAAVKDYQKKNGLVVDGLAGPKTFAKLTEVKAETAKPAETTKPADTTKPGPVAAETTTIKMGRAEYAAHGTKCFTVAVVAMAGDKIVGASIDDYQFISKAVVTGVPNSDKDFGANYKDPSLVLASKRTNTEYYSEHMKEEAGATIHIDKSYDAIQTYVKGKTVAELEAILAKNTKEQMVDAVSGATLVDTQGYISAIVAAAKNAKQNSSVQVKVSELDNLKMGRTEYAAHGTKCFTVAVTAMIGDKIVGASIDDYQFISKDLVTGVPNSDKDFGANYKDPSLVLASKRTNTEYYSEHMKEEAGATIKIDKSYDAIQAYAAGKTIAELEKALSKNTKEQMVDAVSGATLVDTQGYISAIVNAAKITSGAAKNEAAALVNLKIGRAEYAAHGTKCFTVAVVAMAGDKIVGASIDDYQFMSTAVATGVPNSDKDFGANYKDPSMVLASKRTNADYYSEHMKEAAGATVRLDKSYDAIQEYVKGKTVAELEATLAKNTKEQMVDAVSGATLVDTQGYISAIVAAAKNAKQNSSAQVKVSDLANLKMGRTEYAAHGTKCFTVAVTAVIGNRIVAASLDDYQFISKDLVTGVPNSDKDFGANYKDPSMVLASKRTNTEYYSEHMKEEAGATIKIDKSYDEIQAYAAGKTIAELEGTLSKNTKEQMVDVVSGATLVDTQGYVTAIVAAAKAAK